MQAAHERAGRFDNGNVEGQLRLPGWQCWVLWCFVVFLPGFVYVGLWEPLTARVVFLRLGAGVVGQ